MRFRIILLSAALLSSAVPAFAQTPAACPSPTAGAKTINDLAAGQLTSLAVMPIWGANELGMIPSDQPVTLHLTFPADLPATPSFVVAGTLGRANRAFPVRSWTPASSGADARRSGDLVIDPIPEQAILADGSTSLRLNVLACTGGALQLGTTTGFLSSHLINIGIALAITLVLYIIGALSIPRRSEGRWSRLNPLWMALDGSGRASLAQMQIIFFTVIVLYLVTYILLRTGILASLSQSVLLLLGIAGVGSIGGTLATNNTQRLSFENWAWLRHKGWTTATGLHVDAPRWRDIFTTNDEFDPYKFQMVSFSFVIGTALLMVGLNGLADFTIPQTLLGLIGLSQATYIGGKIVTPTNFADLDTQLTELRKAQDDFLAATADKWITPPTPPATALDAAKADNRAAYLKFKALRYL
jgi:hypothetical protein